MKILVVDNNRSYHWIHRRKLNHLKATISFAQCPKEAISEVTEKDYDVILIHHLLGDDERGPDLYNQIRKKGFSGPVFILSSDKEPQRQKYNGIEALVHKKISGRELSELIVNSLHNQNIETEELQRF